MQTEIDNSEIYKQRVKKIDHAKIRIDEIKAKVNSLEKELLEIKQLDRLLLQKNRPPINRRETVYRTDNILVVGDLSFQRFPRHQLLSWEEAKEYAKKLRVAGYSDWRLPTIEELEKLLTRQSLQNAKGYRHYILRDFLDIMPQDSCFWSSSEENELYAWLADFGNGYTYWRRKTLKYYTIYVRKT